MATLRDIKQRIVGIKNTQQITKAMKMVAAARLRRAQENIINAKPYSRKMAEVLSHLLKSVGANNNPLFTQKEVKSVAVVVVTSDRGLCGGFNMNAIRLTEELIDGDLKDLRDNNSIQLYCVGKKGNDYFSKKEKYNVVGSFPGIFSKLEFEFAAQLANELTNKFLNGEIDKVIIVYNEFKSVIQQKITAKQFLPIENIEEVDNSSKHIEYIYEPNQEEIIGSLLPRHLKGQFWTVLLDSYAAELGARMTAMEMATENAKEMIRSLQIKFNKERQAAITKEILEIVSGANALKSA
ncbi:MAG: ATP synthase F1 subunit gamma [Ignavibacteriales bacterium]|nr:ATP synthase F1 subunit gamma [Ignavibacteriales bacterium]MCB9217849.1 ATP synthase F1 subunit gamma [Ignavibacteriales bacterium]